MEKLTIEAIRVNHHLSRNEMAEKLGMNLDRYTRIVNGKTKLLATELISIHELFNIPYENIVISKS